MVDVRTDLLGIDESAGRILCMIVQYSIQISYSYHLSSPLLGIFIIRTRAYRLCLERSQKEGLIESRHRIHHLSLRYQHINELSEVLISTQESFKEYREAITNS